MQDDRLLSQYARDGSEAAFGQIVSRHLTLVYSTCLREIGSAALAEDAVQVVFLLLARKAKTLHTGPSLAGWLYNAARFVAKDVRKREARRRLGEERVMQEAAHRQEPSVPEWERVEPLLNDAFSALKPGEREAILLRFLEGQSLAETGAALGLSEDAARMRVSRAVEKMRRYLTSHGAPVTGLLLTGLLTSEAARPAPAHAAALTQGTLQSLSAGPTANVLLLSKGVSQTMKIMKVKFAALAAVLVLGGSALPPLARALSPQKATVRPVAAPAPLAVPDAPSPAKPTDPAPTSGSAAQETKPRALVLQHTVPMIVVTLARRPHRRTMPTHARPPRPTAPAAARPPAPALTDTPQTVLSLLNAAQSAADADKTLTADFTYVVTDPVGGLRRDAGTIKLMKPNYADIRYNVGLRTATEVHSDGQTVWTYHPVTNVYQRQDADPQGKNVNVWRLVTVGGFFSVYTWIRGGLYADPSDLHYRGTETVDGVAYQVLEHTMVGQMHGRPFPFDQKIYLGPDHLIHRFTLDFTIDGKPGTEYADLSNLRLGAPMQPADFAYSPPVSAVLSTKQNVGVQDHMPASPEPLPLLGKITASFALDKDQRIAYRVSLPAGASRVVLDTRRADGQWGGGQLGNVTYSLSYADRSQDGTQDEAINQHGIATDFEQVENRAVDRLDLHRPGLLTLNVHNSGVRADYWLTVVPGTPTSVGALPLAVPLFGKVVPKTMALGEDAAGRLEQNGYAYFHVSLKAGTYQSSLHFSSLSAPTALNGDLALLDEEGGMGAYYKDINELHGSDAPYDSVSTFTLKKDGVFLLTISNQWDETGGPRDGAVNYVAKITPVTPTVQAP